jgi:hypothetical protein
LFTYRCETFSAYNGYVFKRSVTKHLCIQRATRPVFRAFCFLGTVAAPKSVKPDERRLRNEQENGLYSRWVARNQNKQMFSAEIRKLVERSLASQ